tara:strand:+ start:234 stop:524 length:291 start_codon:yes stop_codon:yes gene_type:complete
MSKPEPKFRKGMIVRYNKEKRDELTRIRKELRDKYPNEKLGNQPIHNLLIYTEPRWSPGYNTYMYEYEYGYGCTSEGSALETDLEMGNNEPGFKIF